ncbi:hypothetical protein NBU61_27750, partial [Escherichia coli]|uniref:hypothetical protein n=1 Tax=Escherichia coli TaxID=562 RepID=UPI001BC86620
ILTFQNHTNRPLTDFGGKTSIFSHPVYLFLREFSLQDFRGGSCHAGSLSFASAFAAIISSFCERDAANV